MGLADEKPEHSPATRWVTDERPLVLGQPLRDELDERLTVGTDHTQGAIARAHQRHSRADHAGRDLGKVQAWADRDNRVEQLAHPVLRPARGGDPRAQLGHQVLEVQGLRTRPGRRDQRDLAL